MTRNTLLLSDQRILSWIEAGDPHGEPVLFCTGAGTSAALYPPIESLLRNNIRLISVDRPGLGWSSHDPQKSLTSWADDVKQLLQHLGLTRLRCIGFSQGAPFAFSLAAHNLATKIAIVSGQDDFYFMRAMLDEHLKALLETAASDNDFENKFAAQVDADGMFHMVMHMSSPHDQAFFSKPTFKTLYKKSIDEAFRQGPAGYVRDFFIAGVQKWPFNLESLTTPVDIWYGKLDTSPSHSPDFGTTMAARVPNSNHFVIAQEGSSLLWTQSDAILKNLLQDNQK